MSIFFVGSCCVATSLQLVMSCVVMSCASLKIWTSRFLLFSLDVVMCVLCASLRPAGGVFVCRKNCKGKSAKIASLPRRRRYRDRGWTPEPPRRVVFDDPTRASRAPRALRARSSFYSFNLWLFSLHNSTPARSVLGRCFFFARFFFFRYFHL